MNEYHRYRFLEMIPGSLVWLTFFLAAGLSFFKPLWVLYFILAFDLYWLFRVSYFIFYLTISWNRYRHATKVDWLDKLKKEAPAWKKKYHLIFLPTYKESLTILRATFENLHRVSYPLEKFIIVLCGEEKDKERFLANAHEIQQEFGSLFGHFVTSVHPVGLPGEIPGKGSNMNYAGHLVQKMIDSWKIPYEEIIVSAFDIDTCVHPQYFAHLTYLYCTIPNPLRTSYQPVALYNNNIWQSNPILRISAFGTTFWLLAELARPDRLFTFSSHSMPFRALVDVGF